MTVSLWQNKTQCRSDKMSLIEITRRFNKARLVAQELGSLHPGKTREDLARVHDVLEVGCGPGGWVLAIAQEAQNQNNEMTITGLDTSTYALASARSDAFKQHLAHVIFERVSRYSDPFPFPDASFDLVRIQFLNETLSLAPYDWPHILAECWQLLRPGGLVCITECDATITNAPACEELLTLFLLALKKSGGSFSPTARQLGLICELEPFIHDAAFQTDARFPHFVDFSFGANDEWKHDHVLLSRMHQSLIVSMEVASQEHVNVLCQQQKQETKSPMFHASLPILTLWGRKT